MDDINNKCRTCFTELSKEVQSLTKKFTDEGKRQKSFAELLNDVANINIHNDKYSKLPKAICGCCTRKLKAAHAFVEQAKEVNEKLYSISLQTDNFEGKPLDCLQEVQIDMVSCADIKTESENVYGNSNYADSTCEAEYLKKVKLKEEVPEEDTLAPCYNKSEENLEEGKCFKNLLDMTWPDISTTEMSEINNSIPNIFEHTMHTSNDSSDDKSRIGSGSDNKKTTKVDFLDINIPDVVITTEMSEISDNAPNAFEHTMDTSDDNSDNKSLTASGSDDSEWQLNKSNTSNKKCFKKKTLSITNSKKATKAEAKKEKVESNEDEWLHVKCNACDKIFDNSHLLKQHLRFNHVPDELKIQCPHCESKFNRRHNMNAHMRRVHKAEYLDELQKHPKKLNTEKQYACQQCPRSYTNKYKLIAHVNRHHNPENKNNPPKERALLPKNPFLCTLCGLRFDTKGNLNIHSRRHTGEKPFKCEFCDRAYPRLYEVTVHRRTHTGEKPYQCTTCLKSFRKSNKLKIHMRTHTNERPYKCTQCEKAFKQSKDLNIHKRTHTGERPYKCRVCDSTFTQSNSLRVHQIKQQHLDKANVGRNCIY